MRESLLPQVCEAPARVPLRKVSPPSAVPSRVCPRLFRLPWGMATRRASWGRKAASEGRDAEFALNAAARGCRACAHRLRPGQGLSLTWMEGLLGVGAPAVSLAAVSDAIPQPWRSRSPSLPPFLPQHFGTHPRVVLSFLQGSEQLARQQMGRFAVSAFQMSEKHPGPWKLQRPTDGLRAPAVGSLAPA